MKAQIRETPATTIMIIARRPYFEQDVSVGVMGRSSSRLKFIQNGPDDNVYWLDFKANQMDIMIAPVTEKNSHIPDEISGQFYQSHKISPRIFYNSGMLC